MGTKNRVGQGAGKIWKDYQCANLGDGNYYNLKGCKDDCRKTEECTAVNYCPGHACVLRACKDPIPAPVTGGPAEWHCEGHLMEAECGLENMDCQVANGMNYRGKTNHTISGKDCQAWSVKTPQDHKYGIFGEHNMCRNPDGEKGVWCYTTHRDTRWEYCDVRKCSQCDRGYATSYNFPTSEEIKIDKGKLINNVMILPYLGKEFSISFKLFINEVSGYPWQSVMHITIGNTGEDRGKMGFQIPTVAVNVYKDLYVIFPMNGNDSSKAVGKVEENKWINIDIMQQPTKIHDQYFFEVDLNGRKVWMEENKTPKVYKNPRIYVSSPWHPEVDGKIKELTISSKLGHGPTMVEIEEQVCSASYSGTDDSVRMRFKNGMDEVCITGWLDKKRGNDHATGKNYLWDMHWLSGCAHHSATDGLWVQVELKNWGLNLQGDEIEICQIIARFEHGEDWEKWVFSTGSTSNGVKSTEWKSTYWRSTKWLEMCKKCGVEEKNLYQTSAAKKIIR